MQEHQFYTNHSTIAGIGLFVRRSFEAAEMVGVVDGPIRTIEHFTPELSRQTANWIGTGPTTWIDTDASVFRFINHSCEPNVALVTEREVMAIKPIPADTEIIMDYSLTEAEVGWCMSPCRCQAPNCRGTIEPITKLPHAIFARHEAHIPEPFRELYRSSN